MFYHRQYKIEIQEVQEKMERNKLCTFLKMPSSFSRMLALVDLLPQQWDMHLGNWAFYL